MRIEHEPTLAEFRGLLCAWCLRRTDTVGHHIFTKGAGQLDIRINLIPLCPFCHQSNHDGNGPNRAQLLEIVGRREGCSAEMIVEMVFALRRIRK